MVAILRSVRGHQLKTIGQGTQGFFRSILQENAPWTALIVWHSPPPAHRAYPIAHGLMELAAYFFFNRECTTAVYNSYLFPDRVVTA